MNKLRSSLIGFLLTMIFVFVFAGEALAYDYYETPIRVRIDSDGSTAEITASVSVGSYQVLSGNGSAVNTVSVGSSVKLTNGMVLSSVDGNGRFVWNGTEYRGDLIYKDGFVINRLGMEEYLYSVVMKELGGYAPHVEALKAQAIACRNFAYRRLEHPRREGVYDILSDTSDQAYGGFTGERYDTAVGERIRDAVDSTAGMVMYYDEKLVEAYYCANTGGATENVENVWGSSLAYLKGVEAPWDAYPFVGDAGTYSSLKFPTSYEWVYTISFADLAKKVPSVGTITDVSVSHDGCFSGYAKNVTISGIKGDKSYTGAQFRSLLGLRSSHFDVMIGKSVAANRTFTLQHIGSESFDSFFKVSGKILTIQGKGYGHSVGMSQWSACVMADRGYDYAYILNYFYNQNQNNGRLTISQYQ